MSTLALNALRVSANRFISQMRSLDVSAPDAYMSVGAILREVTASIALAEVELSKAEILAELTEVRAFVAQSPFGLRMQTWPRGYPGDFETVEWIVQQANQASPGSLGYLIEKQCLACTVCQQHRNKINYQANLIATTVERGAKNILLIAAGSALDLQSVWYSRQVRASRFVLNDIDPSALESAKQALAGTNEHVLFITGNALALASQIASTGPFDLILTGGLFDYLDDRAAKLMLRIAFTKWLRPGGVFYFSNIAKGNPYRHWMEYLENWKLIERDETAINSLLSGITAMTDYFTIEKDPTGLTLLVKVNRKVG